MHEKLDTDTTCEKVDGTYKQGHRFSAANFAKLCSAIHGIPHRYYLDYGKQGVLKQEVFTSQTAFMSPNQQCQSIHTWKITRTMTILTTIHS